MLCIRVLWCSDVTFLNEILLRIFKIAKDFSLSTLFQVLSSEEVPSKTSIRRIDGSLFDGSYLGLAATQAQQPQVPKSADGGRGAVQTCSEPVSLSSASELSSTYGQTKQHRSHKTECREPHSESCHRCERCQGSGQNSVYGTQQWRSGNSSHLENGHHDSFNKCKCERYDRILYSSDMSSCLNTLLSCRTVHFIFNSVGYETNKSHIYTQAAECECHGLNERANPDQTSARSRGLGGEEASVAVAEDAVGDGEREAASTAD